MKVKIDSKTYVVKDYTSSLSITGRSSTQKIYYGKTDLHNNIDQMDLSYIHRIFHSIAEYTFLSSIHKTFSMLENILLGHKARINKF